MKRAVLTFILSLSLYFAFGQCGPYTITSRDSTCYTFVITVSGAATARQIIWTTTDPPFDTTYYPIDTVLARNIGYGTTVAGGNSGGIAANQLNYATGIFVDAAGNLYVADQYNNRIQEFPAGSTSATNGITVAGGNGQGNAANQLDQPAGVYVDASGNIYVADESNQRVQKFPAGSTSATNATTVGVGMSTPYGICVDGAGIVYVADPSDNLVIKFAPGGTTGVIVAGGNGAGGAANQLDAPTSVCLDTAGNLYVADPNNARIQKFAAGSTAATNGVTVAGGYIGSGPAELFLPEGVFVDAYNNIYVADFSNARVQQFPAGSTAGTLGITVAGGNGAGSAANQLNQPGAVYVDPSGNIYVADINNVRVQEWQPTITIDTSISVNLLENYSAMVTDKSGCTVRSNIVSPQIGVSAYFTVQPSGTPHLWYVADSCMGTGLSYVWYWGDGTSSIGDTPSHTYDSAGYYDICLSVTNSTGCTANYCDSGRYMNKTQTGQMVYVQVLPGLSTGINTITAIQQEINYYNNTIHFSESLLSPTDLRLYDLSGKVVQEQQHFTGDSWPVGQGLAAGVYIIGLQSDGNVLSKKLVITH